MYPVGQRYTHFINTCFRQVTKSQQCAQSSDGDEVKAVSQTSLTALMLHVFKMVQLDADRLFQVLVSFWDVLLCGAADPVLQSLELIFASGSASQQHRTSECIFVFHIA